MQSPSRTAPGKYPRKMNKREAGVLGKFAKQVATVLYNFSNDGGAVGTVSFGAQLPANAVVTAIYSDEQTNITSGGSATLQLKAGSTNLSDAIAIASFAGNKSHALASSATAIKVTSASELKLAIATAALTAGKVRLAVEFYISE